MKRYLYLLISSFSYFPLQAQTLEGTFSFQGEEVATSAIQLTDIGGQPFEGTVAGTPLSYGFIEMVSTANEYTTFSSLTLENDKVSVMVGEKLQLKANTSPAEVDNTMFGWHSSNPSVVTVKDGTVSALQKGKATVTVVSPCGIYADMCEVTAESDPTSIEEVNSGDRVYPTVTKDNLYMDLQQAQTVYIINVAGKVCGKAECVSGQNTISMQRYPAGIYFIRMGSKVVKVIKR